MLKITRKQIDKILSKKSLDDMTEHELRIILRAVTNEHYNRGIGLDLKQILELNAACIITEDIPRLGCPAHPVKLTEAANDTDAIRKLKKEGVFKPEGLTIEGSRLFAIGLANQAMENDRKKGINSKFGIERDTFGYYYAVAIKQ